MRGAVLYKAGLHLVTERLTRASYGVIVSVPFRPGYHPIGRKYTALDGMVLCRGVMDWYVLKVRTFNVVLKLRVKSCGTEWWWNMNSIMNISSTTISLATFYTLSSSMLAKTKLRLRITATLVMRTLKMLTLISAIKVFTKLTVDLRQLPKKAFTQVKGASGKFSRVTHVIGIKFGAGGMEFQFIFDGKVIGTVNTDFI